MQRVATLTGLVLTLEDRLTDDERRTVSPIVSMAIAASMSGIPQHEVGDAFEAAIAVLERFIEKRELSGELAGLVAAAAGHWESGPQIARIRVREVRAAYLRRKQRAADNLS